MSDTYRYTLGPWLQRFFLDYTVTERNLTYNTRESYRRTFLILLGFLTRKLGKDEDSLTVWDLSASSVLQFLAHLEDKRGCSVPTRNQRLAAIRAFARFVGSREPALVAWCGEIRSIPSKKSVPPSITWLTKSEVDAILAVPDRNTLRGRTEYALLLFLYNTGARASEAVQLRVGDIQFGQHAGRHDLVTLHGKGGKTRQCPLLPDTMRVLAELIEEHSDSNFVFLSRYGKPYTRFGLYRLVERCAAGVPSLCGRKITPHVLRHTIACELVRAEVDLNIIRALLGHVDVKTTNIYAEVDPATKARALALCEAVDPGTSRPWKEKKGLLAFLKSL